MRSLRSLLIGCFLGALGHAMTAEFALAQCIPAEVDKLLASDASGPGRFGRSVSISGDVAVCGAPVAHQNGAAYVYEFVDGQWTEVAKLTASDGARDDFFGNSVSISGSTIIVGAVYDDDSGADCGSAYLFDRVNGVWTETAKLRASGGMPYDHFGHSVAICRDIALVGVPDDDEAGADFGSVHVFERRNGVWSQTARILAADGAAGDFFGCSLSISDDTALIGAYGDDDRGIDSGSAYVFMRSNGVWTPFPKLLPSDGGREDSFGWSVSIRGEWAIIGSSGHAHFAIESGSAYLFQRQDALWLETAELLASDGAAGDSFGAAVSIEDDRAVVGAPGDDVRGHQSGSCYLFENVNGGWMQVAKLLASGEVDGDGFGNASSMAGDAAVVGSQGDDNRWADTGSAYVVDVGCRLLLRVDATCPSGGAITVSWTRATPGGRVALIYGRQTGHLAIPKGVACAGTILDLAPQQIRLVYLGYAGANGSQASSATAGLNACGGYLQLLDIATCGTSKIAKIE